MSDRVGECLSLIQRLLCAVSLSALSHRLVPVQWLLRGSLCLGQGCEEVMNLSRLEVFFFSCIHSHYLLFTGAVMLAVHARHWDERTIKLPA